MSKLFYEASIISDEFENIEEAVGFYTNFERALKEAILVHENGLPAYKTCITKWELEDDEYKAKQYWERNDTENKYIEKQL